MSSKSRVFILDDHEIVRRGIIDLVGQHFDVVGESGCAREGIAMICELRPDVAVLDAQLPDGNGIEVCREIQSSAPDVNCMILTSHDDDRAMVEAVLAGALAYVLKQVRSNALLETIGEVAAGRCMLDPARVADLQARLRREHDQLASLTTQERRVLWLVADGLTNRQIGREMDLTEKTVKNYFSRVLAKMGIQSRTQAAVAIERLRTADNGHSTFGYHYTDSV